MKILLTNDDGINSKGLLALYNKLKECADVSIVAPETEQSAVGHAITLSDPLRVKEITCNDHFFGYAVSGTPSDCVKIAVHSILKNPPDMVISGINIGSNSATNILYSGTVSAATEGTILGIPSIAVSLDSFIDPDFAVAADFMKSFVPFVFKKRLPRGTFLNVNVPALKKDEIKGLSFTKMGKARFIDNFHKRVDPRGHVYYWQGGEMNYDEEEEGTDNGAIRSGNISITPIQFDLTDYNYFKEIKKWDFTFE